MLLFGLKPEPADLADLGSDIVSMLVKVTIGNMLVITSGGGGKAATGADWPAKAQRASAKTLAFVQGLPIRN